MTSIGITLVWCILQVTVVSVAAILLYFLAARGGATARSSVALSGLLLAAALAPLAFLPWPHWRIERDAASASPTTISGNTGTQNPLVPWPVPQSSAPDLESPWTAAINGFVAGLSEAPAAERGSLAAERTFHWPTLIAVILIGASVAGLGRFLLGMVAVRRSIRRAKPLGDQSLADLVDLIRAELSCVAQVEIRESADIATAATTGLRRPVLLVPPDWRSWTGAERRAVIAHELAHVKRRDFSAALLSQAALAVNFYHPLVHWLAGRLRLEQELAADALAATVSGGRAAYLRCLAELALRRSDGRIAWPARAFLPSRRTFLRRIEMLRDPRRAVDRPAPMLRIATAASLLMFAVVVAGIRPDPAHAQQPRATVKAGAAPGAPGVAVLSGAAAQNDASPVVFIPPTATYVIVAKPQEILADPAVQPFAGEIEKSLSESASPVFKALMGAGVSPRNVETLVVGISTAANQPVQTNGVALRMTTAIDEPALAKQAQAVKTSNPYGKPVYQFADDAFLMVGDKQTLLLAPKEDDLLAMIISGQVSPASSPWRLVSEHLDSPAAAVLIDGESVSVKFREMLQQELSTPQAAMAKAVGGTMMPLFQDVKYAGLALTLGKSPGLKGYALCDDESGAERVRDTLQALLTMGKNMVRQAKTQIADQPPQQQTLSKMFLPIAETLLDSANAQAESKEVTLTAESGASAAIALGLLLPAIQQAREAARRTVSMNNLKQIGIAFHNYHDKHGYYPPAVVEENGVQRSWRVELLPFLDQQALYDEYRKNEPWDSEHNKEVLAKMPAVFKDPSDPSAATSTSYYVFTGNGALFSGKPVDLKAGGKGPGMLDVTDGTSATLLTVEAKRDVPWTKPDDIPFDPEKVGELLQKDLGGSHADVFLVGIVDGSVRTIPKTIDPQVLKMLISSQDGEVVPSF